MKMLANHPQPEIPPTVSVIFDALTILDGDRLNTESRIMYCSIAAYCDRNIPVQLQHMFIELLQHADKCMIEKRHELNNRERVELGKNG